MRSSGKFNSAFFLFLMVMMLVMIGLFVLFEQKSILWVSSVSEKLEYAGGKWLFISFLIIVLSCDVVLPIPSSVIAVFSATILGFWGGAFVIWFGLMLSCWFGYLIGIGSNHFLQQNFSDSNDITKAKSMVNKLGLEALVVCRGVPILAEISVIAAGMVQFSLLSFLIVCGLTNAGLAAAYAYIGTQANISNSFLLAIFGSIAVPAGAWMVNLIWQQFFYN